VEEDMRFVFDIDETISRWNDNRDYENFEPDRDVIYKIAVLYNKGHHITLHTARGMTSMDGNRGWIEENLRPPLERWLKKWNVKYHVLLMGKPPADYYIDDKNLSIDQFIRGEYNE
jgi:capsule biosynthesis phosphatase